ncbi:MAG TPA: L,D-transpeptidase family protein [Sphingomicrobium sp.]|nr:L,D-transpeptidase family protein [Sphingomicrobium sp.]
MRISILLASVAALSLAGCGDNRDQSSASGSVEADVSEQSLESQVLAALEDAPRHGLTKDLFLEDDLPGDPSQKREALLRIANDYASALANGKVDPGEVRDVYTIPRPKVDVERAVAEALSKNRFAQWAASLAPQTKDYQALSNAFVQLVQRSPDLPEVEVPSGKVIKPGDSDPRVPAIAANLRALGYLADAQQGQPADVYTEQIAQAIGQFQADTGRKVDGVVGPNTVEALNAGPRDRARQLAIAMERLRWLERDPPPTRIDVNVAAAVLDYYRDGRHADHRRVVVGEPGWETPQLGSPIYRLVANPNWTVPESIVEDEISKKSSAWLARNNFSQKNGQWVQEPGPESALGEVKLDMKNDHAIYLHDTPAKALFSQANRHRSHGCVRVEGAVEFARMLARQEGILDKFDQAMATGDQTFVNLEKEIPVRLLYHTAFLGSDGRIKFTQDAYGWDNDVAQALGYKTRDRPQVEHRPGDVAP